MNKAFEGELQMNALRTLHPICKVPGFRDIFYDEHKFTAKTFDIYVKEIIDMFNRGASGEWETFINSCSSIVAFVDAFPERV